MRFTILDNQASRVITAFALVALAALPFVVVRPLGDPYQAPRMLVASMAVSVLAAVAFGGQRRSGFLRVAAILVGALAVWSILAALVNHVGSSVWGVQGRFQALVSLGLLIAAGFLGAGLRRRSALTLGIALSGSSAVVALVILAQALGGTAATALFGNPTIAGAWLAVSATTGFATAQLVPGRWKTAALVAVGLSTLAVGAAGSRAAALALVAGAGVTLVAGRKHAGWRVAATVAAGGLLLAIGVSVGSAESSAKFTPGALTSGSAESRASIWSDTSRLIAASPLVGVGPGRFLYEYPSYESTAHALAEGPDVRPDQAHSLVLQYAAETGLPAALLFGALACLAILAAWRSARSGDGAALIALAGLMAYLVNGIFGVASIETDLLGWLFGGLALASGSVRSGSPDTSRVQQTALAAVAALLAVATSWYLLGNLSYGRGLDLFAAGDLPGSASVLARAVATDPLTDVYRTAGSDTASYQGPDALEVSLESLAIGLSIEPRSHDLALAQARLKAQAGRPAAEVADAYEQALALYPLGVTVRKEAAVAFRAAGRAAEATDAEAQLMLPTESGTP